MVPAEGSHPAVTVLVPVRGEVTELEEVHANAARELEALGLDFEFLYLLRGGQDESRERLRALQAGDPKRVRIVEFAVSVGEAAMLDVGAERARAPILLTLPAHYEAELDVIAALYRAVREEGVDVAVAVRQRGGAAAVQSEIFNHFVSLAAGARFRDIASATRAVRREVFEEIPLYGDFHRYLPLLAHRAGFGIREVPAAQHPGGGRPRVHAVFTYLWRAIDLLSIFFVSRFTRHPLRLFGAFGSAFAGVGGLLLAVLGVQRLLGTPLADRPVLVLAVLLVGLGVQAFTIGLLGELMLFFHARTLRDYRILAVYECDPPPLPREAESEGTSREGERSG